MMLNCSLVKCLYYKIYSNISFTTLWNIEPKELLLALISEFYNLLKIPNVLINVFKLQVRLFINLYSGNQ